MPPMTSGGKQGNLYQKVKKIFWVLYPVKTGNVLIFTRTIPDTFMKTRKPYLTAQVVVFIWKGAAIFKVSLA